MARPPMTAIIVLSVAGEELSHELGDPWPTASDQEMNMGSHEHPSIYGGLGFDNVFPQPVKKTRPIFAVFKNR